MSLAIQFNISVYDACYLDQARSARLSLATNDIALAVRGGVIR